MEQILTCCFTGHRPQKFSFGFNEQDDRCKNLKKILRERIEYLITQQNVTYFITGMALGVDLFAAEIVMQLKQNYPHIQLECAIPCESQSKRWSKSLQNRYEMILSQCVTQTVLQKYYTSNCMLKRNQYMVDHADIILAIWNGTPGGTEKTIQYAKQQNKRVWLTLFYD